MKVLIIEDEKPAADKLRYMLSGLGLPVEVVGVLPSVKKAVAWLQSPPSPYDLVFLDIQLADGKSFEIFRHVKVERPIVFVTAYSEYAVEAFKLNSIDYLLKPITQEALAASIRKIGDLRRNLPDPYSSGQIDALQQALSALKKQYKTRFMVKLGEHIRSIGTDKIAYFFSEGRYVLLATFLGKQFVVDHKLEELEELLNPQHFFRINRGYILHIDSIEDVIVHTNSRLLVKTRPKAPKELIVSRERVADFKAWFSGG